MVFFILAGKASRSDRLDSYEQVHDTINAGPRGAQFFVSNIAGDEYVQVMEGVVV